MKITSKDFVRKTKIYKIVWTHILYKEMGFWRLTVSVTIELNVDYILQTVIAGRVFVYRVEAEIKGVIIDIRVSLFLFQWAAIGTSIAAAVLMFRYAELIVIFEHWIILARINEIEIFEQRQSAGLTLSLMALWCSVISINVLLLLCRTIEIDTHSNVLVAGAGQRR